MFVAALGASRAVRPPVWSDGRRRARHCGSIGGVAEVLEDGVNARLVPPGDVDRLAAALIEVASHPEDTIERWRERLPRPRTMREVARDYLVLYAC